MHKQPVITAGMLNTMSTGEYEDYRACGEEFRRLLTHAVMREIDIPAGWDVNGEYRSEFGGLFPVQCRFTPPHGNFCISLCSPGELSPVWMLVFIVQNATTVSLMMTSDAFSPARISHTLSLAARLDADGYGFSAITGTLAMEGSL
ncbi:conjugation system SOS inhibitor PsiB (plasmid) [Paramixta manurensis]|uniref:Conjugation system SOS inhibitor PsiB n=1 Tax=Paramixta manurensis TaxID=2740817 RepID=A0A6M8UHG0_9GAMM|nr:conjugation system SOS inhibitor PsiB [Erwiniaceae bacterium PD-1]